ncbi:SCAN domain-containing protein 3-like [Octopus bimaculoides]|uniref:SCAN domain-containing protein 3-like n=1 Tax=Octopus bimaculoides TaxID=37653 RepID=UPI00071D9709|nr:SCAN domain-containing protein 3-like [Octopus bimaculoides]|eukprot:XP_014777393.1 PREDICTED: SCAN domain-containing protein 3-like [Octopus bimaculoides]
MKKIPLSNNTTSRRIHEMANDVKHQLINILQCSEISIQVDESVVVGNQCLMMVYVRYLSEDLQPCEELLFTEKLPLDSKGATIFHILKFFLFKHNILLSNILACASDGAPSVIGRYRGFSSFLECEISHQVLTVHCLAHRHHLVAKNMNSRLNDVLKLVIKTVNKWKSSPLSDRIFRQLCLRNDEDYTKLLYHTEVQVSSLSQPVQFGLFHIIISFVEDTPRSASLMTKLVLYMTNISKRQFHQFPQLDSLKDELVDEDLSTYRKYLQSLHDNVVNRFQDVIALNIPNWYSKPFEVNAVDCEDDVQEELIALQNDNCTTMRYRRNGKERLWYHQSILNSYPSLWKHLKLFCLPSLPHTWLNLVLTMLELYFPIKELNWM